MTLPPLSNKMRVWGYVAYIAVLLLIFNGTVREWIREALGNDMNSHTVLVPFISLYLIWSERQHLPRQFSTSVSGTIVLGLVAAFFLAYSFGFPVSPGTPLAVLSCQVLFLVFAALTGGSLFLGMPWLRAAMFALAFLVFAAPMPEAIEHGIESMLVNFSAEVAAFFFQFAGIPYVRDKVVFELPNITIQVAQECSGIRSSYVLFITSFLVAKLFLESWWRRVLIVAIVIPLGIIRNGFRILVIGWLCVHGGPQMIDSWIHRHGGPVFFAISLVPLFLIVWLLHWSERRKQRS